MRARITSLFMGTVLLLMAAGGALALPSGAEFVGSDGAHAGAFQKFMNRFAAAEEAKEINAYMAFYDDSYNQSYFSALGRRGLTMDDKGRGDKEGIRNLFTARFAKPYPFKVQYALDGYAVKDAAAHVYELYVRRTFYFTSGGKNYYGADGMGFVYTVKGNPTDEAAIKILGNQHSWETDPDVEYMVANRVGLSFSLTGFEPQWSTLARWNSDFYSAFNVQIPGKYVKELFANEYEKYYAIAGEGKIIKFMSGAPSKFVWVKGRSDVTQEVAPLLPQNYSGSNYPPYMGDGSRTWKSLTAYTTPTLTAYGPTVPAPKAQAVQWGPAWIAFTPNSTLAAIGGQKEILPFPRRTGFVEMGGSMAVRPNVVVTTTSDGKVDTIKLSFIDSAGNKVGNDAARVTAVTEMQLIYYSDPQKKTSLSHWEFFGYNNREWAKGADELDLSFEVSKKLDIPAGMLEVVECVLDMADGQNIHMSYWVPPNPAEKPITSADSPVPLITGDLGKSFQVSMSGGVLGSVQKLQLGKNVDAPVLHPDYAKSIKPTSTDSVNNRKAVKGLAFDVEHTGNKDGTVYNVFPLAIDFMISGAELKSVGIYDAVMAALTKAYSGDETPSEKVVADAVLANLTVYKSVTSGDTFRHVNLVKEVSAYAAKNAGTSLSDFFTVHNARGFMESPDAVALGISCPVAIVDSGYNDVNGQGAVEVPSKGLIMVYDGIRNGYFYDPLNVTVQDGIKSGDVSPDVSEDKRSPTSSGGCTSFILTPLALLIATPFALRALKKR